MAVIFAGLFLASRPAKPPSSGEAEPTRIVKPSADGPSSSDLEIDLSFESDPRRKIPDGGVSGDSPATATAADRLAGEQTDSKDREPTDASTRKPAVLSGVEITVDSVLLGPPRLERAPGRFARPSDSYLIVNLSLKSADDARRLEYNGWSNFRDTSLVDDLDNAYPLKRFRVANIVGQVDRTGVYSDAPATDVLVFERPVSKARRLFLKLPGIALGSRGLVEFMIPVSMIQEFSTDDDAGGGGTADAAAPAFDPDADPDGDVSKIMADIDAIGGGDGSDAAPLEFGEEEDRAAVRRPED